LIVKRWSCRCSAQTWAIFLVGWNRDKSCKCRCRSTSTSSTNTVDNEWDCFTDKKYCMNLKKHLDGVLATHLPTSWLVLGKCRNLDLSAPQWCPTTLIRFHLFFFTHLQHVELHSHFPYYWHLETRTACAFILSCWLVCSLTRPSDTHGLSRGYHMFFSSYMIWTVYSTLIPTLQQHHIVHDSERG
jgi:hypothetical protein